MVVLHVKGKTDDHQFLYETTVAIPVKQLIQELVDVHNMRMRLQRLKVEGDDLALYGPAKPPDKQGLDEDIQAEADGIEPPPRGPTFNKDPNGKRDGNAPVAQVAEMLKKTLDDAAAAASKKQVEKKTPLTKKMLEEHIDTIRGAVMIAYPMGLPEWDNVRMDIEGDEAPSNTPVGIDILDTSAQIWWAGKQMMPENKLCDHIGKNEKTKIVAKLQKKGGGAPQREPAISQDEHKAMLSYYHKKQEEMKKLESNEEDDYTNSAWANTKSLKSHFSGVGNVSVGGRGSSSFNGGIY